MNIIGIDPSLISTGLVINGKCFLFTREKDIYGKKSMKKWFRLGEPIINYEIINYTELNGNYSVDEIIKLRDYDRITQKIVDTILKNINNNEEIKIYIEGYSYHSSVGPLIDLVTFSTLLRKKLYEQVSFDINILSPNQLKTEAGKLSYEPEIKGKKKKTYIYRNNEGIPGGNFTKREIMIAICESRIDDNLYINYIRNIKDELLSCKTFPKPFEDVNDAIILANIKPNNS